MPQNYDYRSMMAGVWLDLDSPDQHSPSADLILQSCGDVAQELQNDMTNTAVGWDVASTPIAVNTVDSRYGINVTDLGKAIRLSATSLNSLDPYCFDVDLVDRQTARAFTKSTYSPGSLWTFAGISYLGGTVAVIEYEAGNPMVEFFGPVDPNLYEYRLWYDKGTVQQDPQLSDRFLPQVKAFHPYARLMISLGCVSYCWWSKLSVGTKKEDLAVMGSRRQELQTSLALKVARQKPSWDNFKLTSHEGGDEKARGFADWQESWGGW